MLTLTITLLIQWAAFFHSAESPSSFPAFNRHLIDTIGSHLGQTDLADLDNDGDLDWVVGEAPWSESRIWWWEYIADDHWERHVLGQADSDVGGACYDVNQDGWVDFWGGSKLYLNQQDGTFTGYDVGTLYSHDSQFGHIDGDDRIDAIANSDEYGLVWYSIPEDPTQPWEEHMIQPIAGHRVHAGVSPAPLGDLDGDGDTDVATAQAWYENVGGDGHRWQQHKTLNLGEEHKYGIGVKTWVADLDQDGDQDIVQSEADNPDSRVAWFENRGDGHFTRHLVKEAGDQQDLHSLILADFDNDGDLDLSSGGGPLSGQPHRVFIWENTAAAGSSPGAEHWKEHVIASMPCHESVGGDVDGDGDIDICLKPWSTGNAHYFLENTLY